MLGADYLLTVSLLFAIPYDFYRKVSEFSIYTLKIPPRFAELAIANPGLIDTKFWLGNPDSGPRAKTGSKPG